jgi:hypothetical protein
MPTIPRTDFYANFDENYPNLIWIDGSDLGDHQIPNPILPEKYSPMIHGWATHWYPRLNAIKRDVVERKGGNLSDYHFVTDDRNLFNSAGAFRIDDIGRTNDIALAHQGYSHPQHKNYASKAVYQGNNNQGYMDEQQDLRMATHQRAPINQHVLPHNELHSNHPFAERHVGEIAHLDQFHREQAQNFNQHLRDHESPQYHQHYMQQMLYHQSQEKQRLFQQHHVEIRNRGQTRQGNQAWI